MEITWLGRNCFRLKGKDGAVVTDPCPSESGYKIGKPAAEVVTVSSREDPGYSYVEGLAGEPFRLDAPGEFEIGGILVTGVATKHADGSRNIIFVCEIDGIRIGHLGLPGEKLPAATLEELKDIDILLMPVGGGNSFASAAAADVMTTIDPRIAIPMNYKTEFERSDLEPLDKFLKETGSKAEPLPKLTVTKSQLPQNLAITLLQPRV
jgi:L-ascorbate metabolism protein UlaG (beta-lactamase superfamily)